MMGIDELATHRQFMADLDEIVLPSVSKSRGRIVKTTGDGFVAEFASVVDAVQCAADMQWQLAGRNADLPSDRRLAYRMGINLGDIIVEENDIYGDDVNIAARLEGLAESGGISVSGNVVRHVRGKLNLEFDDLGEHSMKNIVGPVRIYRVRLPSSGPLPPRTGPTVPTAGSSDTTAAELQATAAYNRPTIVILPFDNFSRDPEQEYFCDGLTSDITTDLSKFSNLLVIAANSAFAYKGRRVKVQDISRDLGARYVLEGSVQRLGDRVRINAQLVDATSGHTLWAERFQRPLAEIFELQDDIVHVIVSVLQVRLNTAERERAARKHPESINAYDAFLKGFHAFALGVALSNETDEYLRQSLQWFETAASLDPGYARAWGLLSYALTYMWFEGWTDESAIARAEECARRAVTLDPNDHDTHWALAYVYANTKRHDLALSEYRNALQLNGNDADMLVDMAESLSYSGDHQKAIDQINYAMQINPHFPEWYRWMLGWARFNVRDYAIALAELSQIVKPNNRLRLIVAAAHSHLSARCRREEQPDLADIHDLRARDAVADFLMRRPDWTIAKERRSVSYRNRVDELHWLDGLRMAGLPEEAAGAPGGGS
jgi:TolB-like protein/cytochrome c-type biogenesis protein CcmH/NrfG